MKSLKIIKICYFAVGAILLLPYHFLSAAEGQIDYLKDCKTTTECRLAGQVLTSAVDNQITIRAYSGQITIASGKENSLILRPSLATESLLTTAELALKVFWKSSKQKNSKLLKNSKFLEVDLCWYDPAKTDLNCQRPPKLAETTKLSIVLPREIKKTISYKAYYPKNIVQKSEIVNYRLKRLRVELAKGGLYISGFPQTLLEVKSPFLQGRDILLDLAEISQGLILKDTVIKTNASKIGFKSSFLKKLGFKEKEKNWQPDIFGSPFFIHLDGISTKSGGYQIKFALSPHQQFEKTFIFFQNMHLALVYPLIYWQGESAAREHLLIGKKEDGQRVIGDLPKKIMVVDKFHPLAAYTGFRRNIPVNYREVAMVDAEFNAKQFALLFSQTSPESLINLLTTNFAYENDAKEKDKIRSARIGYDLEELLAAEKSWQESGQTDGLPLIKFIEIGPEHKETPWPVDKEEDPRLGGGIVYRTEWGRELLTAYTGQEVSSEEAKNKRLKPYIYRSYHPGFYQEHCSPIYRYKTMAQVLNLALDDIADNFIKLKEVVIKVAVERSGKTNLLYYLVKIKRTTYGDSPAIDNNFSFSKTENQQLDFGRPLEILEAAINWKIDSLAEMVQAKLLD